MKEDRGIRTLFWFSLGFTLAVYIAVLSMKTAILPLLSAAVLALWALCRSIRDYRIKILSLSLIGAAVGFLLSYTHLTFTLLPAEELAGETIEVSCRVVEVPKRYDESQSVVVRLQGEDTPSVRCRLTLYNDEIELSPGDELKCTVRFSSARIRYGEESDSLTAKGIFLRGTVKGEAELSGRWSYAWLYAPQLLLEKIKTLCSSLFPEDVSPFHIALLTGDKQQLYEEATLYNDLSRAGLTHVVAVSGMHVSFLVGFLTLIIPAKRMLSLIALPFLLLLAALTGFTPSVCRAVFMQLLLLLSPLARREEDSLTSLAAALMLLLIQNPFAALSVSLQLSFGATAGILLYASPLLERMLEPLPKKGVAGTVARTVCSAVATSLAAMVFTLPLTALHFGTISLVSPLTNALCLWLISFLFVGGYLALGLGALIPALGRFFGSVLAWGDRFIFYVAGKLSALPYSTVYTENPMYLWWMVASYVLFILVLLSSRIRKKEPPLLRAGSVVIFALCVCVGVQYLQHKEEKMTVSVLDVGQGACTLLEQGDTAVVVDCGGTNIVDSAGDRAADYIRSRGRSELSALILTHLHRDHINGVEKLLAQIQVHRLYLPRGQEAEAETEILTLAERYGVEVIYVESELLLSGDGLTVRLTPPPTFEYDEEGIFALCSYGEFDVLITGDADASMERRYLQLTEAEDVEVLLVGHHGSSTSTAERFLDGITPEAAVISVGYNTYSHPTEEVLERLQSRNITIYRTDKDGTVRIQGEKDGNFQNEKNR